MPQLNFPLEPAVGEVYSYGSRSWQWNGIAWKQTGAFPGYVGSRGESSYIYGEYPPSEPMPGDRWFDTTVGVEFVWSNTGGASQWIEIAGTGFQGPPGTPGPQGEQGVDGAFAGRGYSGSQGDIGPPGAGYTGSSSNMGQNIVMSLIWGG
jgi:hypothetical protein